MIAIQFLAMLSMLIDHIGAVWFPDDSTWRIIGRLAFPLYAYALVIGYDRTRDRIRYLKRMGGLAILSQLPYSLAFHTIEANAIATLFVCLLMLMLLDRYAGNRAISFPLLAASIVLLELVPFDYGAYGLLLVLIYRYSKPQWMALLHFTLNVAGIIYKGWTLQLFSLFSTLLILYLPDFMKAMDKVKIPRIVWRGFYPAHLAVIAALQFIGF